MRFVFVLLFVFFVAAPMAKAVPTAAPEAALQMHECVQGIKKVRAECGSLRVFENRAAQSGRRISVHFILLKAQHPNGRVIYVNLGGPGSELSAVPNIANGVFLKELTALRDRYDVLFVDERGFGQSRSIACHFAPVAQPDLYFRSLWPQKIVQDCREKSALTSDLSQYNTPNAVDDLNDLRAALRYKTLIFDVGSYGTFTALVYMRRHPESVESAVLSGVAPPGIIDQAREFANGARVSLDNVAADCERDRACRTNHPQFKAHFLALVHQLSLGPIPVRLKNPSIKRIQTVELSKEVFTDAIRHALYDPEGASYLPLVIDRAYNHDTLPLGEMIDMITQGFALGIDGGAFLSYTCAEIIPFTNSPAALRYAQRASWYGDGRDLAQQHACTLWGVPPLPQSFDTPVRSAAPILMVSGTDDPATPAYEGTQQLRFLSNARQMLVRNAPHDTESPCVNRIIEAFIRADSARGLNLSACAASFIRPPFATKWPPA